jgi:1-acyl-sn-glycerol-3-phosphate acyltransferase
MAKLLAYPLTVIYLFFFGLTILIFHPIQWVCFNVFGYEAHKKSVAILQLLIMRCMTILGTRFTFTNSHDIDVNRPLIIVSNHQSMYDIPPIIWYMRKHHPKFISKVELGSGIPSISYNLKHGGSVLIDRKKPLQAINSIQKFATNIENNNWSAVIFPEGTRSKNGTPKTFKSRGLIALFEGIPSALVVPVTVNNSWEILRYGKFPMGTGAHIKLKVHTPIEVSAHHPEELVALVEKQITESILNDEQ